MKSKKNKNLRRKTKKNKRRQKGGNKNKIVVKLTGGIGNRFFQIMAGYGFAEKWDMDVYVSDKHTKWNHVPEEESIKQVLLIFPNVKLLDTTYNISQISSNFDEHVKPTTDIYIDNYFQDVKYFPKNLPKLNIPVPTNNLIADINKEHLYFIHFRLGDYLSNARLSFDLTKYYIECINKINVLDKKAIYIIISNDISAATEKLKNMKESLKDAQIIYDNNISRVDSLYYMSKCKGGICTHSTFSWMGAYCIKDKNKDLIFMPKPWVKSDYPEEKAEIYPDWATIVNISELSGGSEKTIAYVINLADRKERWEQIQEDFKDSSIELERIDAIRHENGHHGCGLSFQKAIQQAKDKNLESILILEDDCFPLEGYDKRWNITKKWLDSNRDKWGVFNGGARIANGEPDDSVKLKYVLEPDIHLFQGNNIWAAHWLYINSSAYDILLAWKHDLDNGLGALDRVSGDNSKIKNLFIFPFLAIQRNGQSNTNGFFKNFNQENPWNIPRMQNILDNQLPIFNAKKILISFVDKGYEKAKERLKKSALANDITEVRQYSLDDIDNEFKEKHKDILSLPRGAGYWLWKPYLILKTLNDMSDNDILIYCDTAMEFISSIQPYVSALKESFMLFTYPDCFWVGENEYTKGDVFKALGCITDEKVIHTAQLDASHSIWKKNENSLNFVKLWLELCCDKQLLTDEPSIEPNLGGFKDHRHDQSILSCLAKLNKDKYNIHITLMATQNGNCARGEGVSPQMFNHHRERE